MVLELLDIPTHRDKGARIIWACTSTCESSRYIQYGVSICGAGVGGSYQYAAPPPSEPPPEKRTHLDTEK
jgi:hypothetical protein